jgi:hypothetical protein
VGYCRRPAGEITRHIEIPTFQSAETHRAVEQCSSEWVAGNGTPQFDQSSGFDLSEAVRLRALLETQVRHRVGAYLGNDGDADCRILVEGWAEVYNPQQACNRHTDWQPYGNQRSLLVSSGTAHRPFASRRGIRLRLVSRRGSWVRPRVRQGFSSHTASSFQAKLYPYFR